jgi:hypothetical protein
VGHDQFAGYVDFVTETFGQYTTDILAMIEEGNRVGGKMRFHGFHRKELFGVPPSGRHVWWTGMPIFTFEGRSSLCQRGVVRVTAIRGRVARQALSQAMIRKSAPLRQCGRASLLVDLPSDEMAILIEMVVDLGMN